MKDKLLDEERQRRCLEGEIVKLKKFLIDGNAENGVTSNFFKDLFPTFYILCFFYHPFCCNCFLQSKRSHWAENSTSSTLPFENPSKSHKLRESVSAQKDTISKIFEEGENFVVVVVVIVVLFELRDFLSNFFFSFVRVCLCVICVCFSFCSQLVYQIYCLC